MTVRPRQTHELRPQTARDNPVSVLARPWPLFTRHASRLSVKDMLRALGEPPGDLTRAALVVSWQAEDAANQGTIRFAAQPCFFGGVRYWFLCPACGRRVYALYVTGSLSCWRCAGLRYVSWDWRGHFRLSRHYEALARELRHRPGPKPARFTRYVVYAEWHFVRDLASLMRRFP